MHSVSCDACPLTRQPLFTPFDDEELGFMQRFKAGELSVDPGTHLLIEGAGSPQLYTVRGGMGLRYKTLENGRRQVINFVMPGDLIGLQAELLGEMKHSVEATTAMQLCVFRREELWTLYRTCPSRGYDVTWIAAAEEHFLGETIATLGQRNGPERLAWALVRIYQRLRATGMGSEGEVPLPFRQQDMADALGLSLVHTNKTLRKLREQDLVHWSDGVLRLPDLAALAELGLVDLEEAVVRPLL